MTGSDLEQPAPGAERDYFGEFDRAMDDLDQALARAHETAPEVAAALSRVMNVPFPIITTEQRDQLQNALAPLSTLIQQIASSVSRWELAPATVDEPERPS